MAYEDFKDLPKGTASDKILQDKSFNIAKNLTCDGYQLGRRIALTDYQKKVNCTFLLNKTLGCRSSRYPINKQIQ